MPKELMVQLIAFVVVLALVLVSQAIKIVQEWERGVVFRLGRFVRVAGPGIQFIIPFIERMIKVDIRVFTVDVPKQGNHHQGQCHCPRQRCRLLQSC
jgi:regulator of protease activity HflC (stomatin/prohibitin superfamily)